MSDAPAGSALYLALLVVTFALHALLISFVLAGTAYVAGRFLRGGDDALAAASRDWLPFALGAAITAGVAPLLFVQILYQPRFYTANLLLSVRWLAVVPALIVGFYALYLGKSARAATWANARRAAVALAALACFGFVAWSWIEDHALAMQRDPAVWAAHYGAGRLHHADPAVAPRWIMWLGIAALVWPAGLLVVTPGADAGERRRSAVIALVGLVVAAVAAVVTGRATDEQVTVLALAPARPWLYALAAAAAVLAGAWGAVVAGRAPARAVIVGATVVLALALAGAREAMRLAAIDPRLPHRLEHAQGLLVFVVALVAGVGAIAWCFAIARRPR
ncbi:MAG: hypothetical protein IPL61_15760 [Myxococcales bacterium]|nr:hypothetical protein [Myxococcales bacterium]